MTRQFCWAGALAAVLLPATQIWSSTLTDGLVGYWPLNETTGAIAHDASGYGQDGTLINYPGNNGSWVPGKVGGALRFDASQSEYISVPSFIQPTSVFSLSAWVNERSYALWGTIAANWNGVYGRFTLANFSRSGVLADYFAHVGSQGLIEVLHVMENGAPMSLGEWHFVTLVADGASVAIYRDGVLTGSSGFSGDLIPVPEFTIGAVPYGPGDGYWDGDIQDVGLWTRALSVQEIASVYTKGLAGHPLLWTPSVAPVCSAGGPYEVACGAVPASVELNGTGSSNQNGGALAYHWSSDCSGATFDDPNIARPTLTLSSPKSTGGCNISLTVRNADGLASTCNTALVVRDTTPPLIGVVGASPAVLWPPNQKMVDVTLSYSAADNCDSASAIGCRLSVTSNESADQNGGVSRGPDWEVIDSHHIRLRADRSGGGNGRIYTVDIQCSDSSGNSSTQAFQVRVPHDMDKN